MELLDQQMTQWASRLRDDLNIEAADANQIATSIVRDVSNIPDDVVREIHANASVPLQARLDELTGFQDFMDSIHFGAAPRPSFVRAQVVYQNYVSFVYLGDACFNILRKNLAPGCTAKKCMKFLTDNPIRAFRNAIAHANWSYLDDFSGLQYWARKGAAADEPMVRFDVTQIELGFWQSLARCDGYSSFLTLIERKCAE